MVNGTVEQAVRQMENYIVKKYEIDEVILSTTGEWSDFVQQASEEIAKTMIDNKDRTVEFRDVKFSTKYYILNARRSEMQYEEEIRRAALKAEKAAKEKKKLKELNDHYDKMVVNAEHSKARARERKKAAIE